MGCHPSHQLGVIDEGDLDPSVFPRCHRSGDRGRLVGWTGYRGSPFEADSTASGGEQQETPDPSLPTDEQACDAPVRPVAPTIAPDQACWPRRNRPQGGGFCHASFLETPRGGFPEPDLIRPGLSIHSDNSVSSVRFEHVRHRPSRPPAADRELVVACAEFRSRVNLSHIVRTCGCFGIRRVIACGTARLEERIARDGADAVILEVHRSLPPVLARLRREGWQLVGLEQTTGSESLFSFPFQSRTVLVAGNERLGLEPDVLALLDRVVEIPMAGLPHSLNVATSTAIAVYEYCRQFPEGPVGQRPGTAPT